MADDIFDEFSGIESAPVAAHLTAGLYRLGIVAIVRSPTHLQVVLKVEEPGRAVRGFPPPDAPVGSTVVWREPKDSETTPVRLEELLMAALPLYGSLVPDPITREFIETAVAAAEGQRVTCYAEPVGGDYCRYAFGPETMFDTFDVNELR